MNQTLFYTAALTLTLAACSPPTPAVLPVSSVTVTGPSNSALKIEGPTTLTAVAKDSNGNSISGKTFVWSSSNPQIATVDQNGVVLAKRFGEVKISASSDGVKGESMNLKTYGLEVIGGTNTNAASNFVGTAFVLRFRKADGSVVQGNLPFKTIGPAGWGDPDTGTFNLSQPQVQANLAMFPNKKAVSGLYQVDMTVGGEVYSSFSSIDANSVLASSGVLSVDVVNSSKIIVKWSGGIGNIDYSYVNDENFDLFKAFRIVGPSTDVEELSLVKGKKYSIKLALESSRVDFSKAFPAFYNSRVYILDFIGP